MSKALEWTVANICNGLAVHVCTHTYEHVYVPTSAAVVDSQRLTPKQLAKFNKARLDKLAVR
jgi:hypothetical protein